MPIPAFQALNHITLARFIGEHVRGDSFFQAQAVKYTADYPKERADVPAICYRIHDRSPGHQGLERYGPRLRTTYVEEEGQLVEVYGQWETVIFRFDCCAHTGAEAEELAYNFETTLRQLEGHFLNYGVAASKWERQFEDTLLPRTNDIPTRTLEWMFLLNRLDYKTVDPVTTIRIRGFMPQRIGYEEVIRGATNGPGVDTLSQAYVSKIIFVSDPSPSGIARTNDYLFDTDFRIIYEPLTGRTHLEWIEAGRQPDPGASYFVRYNYWDPILTLTLPDRMPAAAFQP